MTCAIWVLSVSCTSALTTSIIFSYTWVHLYTAIFSLKQKLFINLMGLCYMGLTVSYIFASILKILVCAWTKNLCLYSKDHCLYPHLPFLSIIQRLLSVPTLLHHIPPLVLILLIKDIDTLGVFEWDCNIVCLNTTQLKNLHQQIWAQLYIILITHTFNIFPAWYSIFFTLNKGIYREVTSILE